MTAAHAFHLAAELEVAADLGVVQNAEAVHQRKGSSHALEYNVGIELELRLVTNGEDDDVHPLHRRGEIFFQAEVLERFLPVEEP